MGRQARLEDLFLEQQPAMLFMVVSDINMACHDMHDYAKRLYITQSSTHFPTTIDSVRSTHQRLPHYKIWLHGVHM